MNIRNTQFYIKIKIDSVKDTKILKILGFHEDEYKEAQNDQIL